MKKQKDIEKFYFDKAKYMVGDAYGNQVILEIDYPNKQFDITEYRLVGREMQLLKMQVAIVAHKLIKKKHNVNFSDRIEI